MGHREVVRLIARRRIATAWHHSQAAIRFVMVIASSRRQSSADCTTSIVSSRGRMTPTGACREFLPGYNDRHLRLRRIISYRTQAGLEWGAGVNGLRGRSLLKPPTLLLRDHCRRPQALPRSSPTPWSCSSRRAAGHRCLGSTVAPGQSEIGRSTIRAVSRPAASSFKKATSMPEREYAICRDYCF